MCPFCGSRLHETSLFKICTNEASVCEYVENIDTGLPVEKRYTRYAYLPKHIKRKIKEDSTTNSLRYLEYKYRLSEHIIARVLQETE